MAGLLIELKPGLSAESLDKLIKPHGGKTRKVGQSKLHIADLPGNASEVAILKQLDHRPEFVESKKLATCRRRASW